MARSRGVAEHDIRPWQTETFKFSTDPPLAAKIPDHLRRDLIERQALRRGDFANVHGLVTAIARFCGGWSQRCQPFRWSKDAHQVLAELPPHPPTATTARRGPWVGGYEPAPPAGVPPRGGAQCRPGVRRPRSTSALELPGGHAQCAAARSSPAAASS
jgi:hypothetical protein